MEVPFYDSGLIPAVPNVSHGYRNFWIRDGWYVGICSNSSDRQRIWNGIINILDKYKWKLEIHANQPPVHWYEYFHVRFSPSGDEIQNEHWLHNQFDAMANAGEVCLDQGRFDLADLIIDYLKTCQVHRNPAAGMYEDRNTLDAYTLASCLHFLRRAWSTLTDKKQQIAELADAVEESLDRLLPYATASNTVCLSLLGVIWPFDVLQKHHDRILDLVNTDLRREPFGFIRYRGDCYDGEHFNRGEGTEVPWLLGDCFMSKIQPNNPLWKNRLKEAYRTFKCMPEAFFPETMKPNRNTPLIWAESLYKDLFN
jgi:phosphorylase kinase alpha/beta subunit